MHVAFSKPIQSRPWHWAAPSACIRQRPSKTPALAARSQGLPWGNKGWRKVPGFSKKLTDWESAQNHGDLVRPYSPHAWCCARLRSFKTTSLVRDRTCGWTMEPGCFGLVADERQRHIPSSLWNGNPRPKQRHTHKHTKNHNTSRTHLRMTCGQMGILARFCSGLMSAVKAQWEGRGSRIGPGQISLSHCLTVSLSHYLCGATP